MHAYEYLSTLLSTIPDDAIFILGLGLVVTAAVVVWGYRNWPRSHDPDLASPSFDDRVAAAIERAMCKIATAKQDKAEADGREHRAKLARLENNPWNRGDNSSWHPGGPWNMTRQIELMREDFDKAQALAAEAGVDISHLRHRMEMVPSMAVIDDGSPIFTLPQAWTEGAHDASRHIPSPAYQVDESYFPCFSDPEASRRANRSLRPNSMAYSPEAVAMARVEASIKNRNDRANKSRKARRRVAKAKAESRFTYAGGRKAPRS